MSKEKVVKGKTQIPSPKTQWVPSKENPSGIGSSKAFAAPTEQTNDMPAAIFSPSAASTQAQ